MQSNTVDLCFIKKTKIMATETGVLNDLVFNSETLKVWHKPGTPDEHLILQTETQVEKKQLVRIKSVAIEEGSSNMVVGTHNGRKLEILQIGDRLEDRNALLQFVIARMLSPEEVRLIHESSLVELPEEYLMWTGRSLRRVKKCTFDNVVVYTPRKESQRVVFYSSCGTHEFSISSGSKDPKVPVFPGFTSSGITEFFAARM